MKKKNKNPPPAEPTKQSVSVLSSDETRTFLRSLSGASKLLHRWNVMVEEEWLPLAVDCDALGLSGAVLATLDVERDPPGFDLYVNWKNWDIELDYAESIESGDEPEFPPPARLRFSLEKTADVDAVQRRELEQHGWEPGDEAVWPVFHARDNGGRTRALTRQDLLRVWALSEATERFVEQYEARWEEIIGSEDLTTATFVLQNVPGGPTVKLTAPHPEMPPDEDDGPDLDAFDQREEAAGRTEEQILLSGFLAETLHSYIDEDCATPFSAWNEVDLEVYLLEHVPRKVTLTDDQINGTTEALARYFDWEAEQGNAHATALARHTRALAKRTLEELRNPANFGMAKSLFSAVSAMGFDVNDDVQLQRGMAEYNRRLTAMRGLNLPPIARPFPELAPSDSGVSRPVTREGPKIGRNDPCHCGSGKKFKKCHGA